jgi:hypothetical protein
MSSALVDQVSLALSGDGFALDRIRELSDDPSQLSLILEV